MADLARMSSVRLPANNLDFCHAQPRRRHADLA
jgi:hypothetical protein